jgi:hypothetical protein
MRDHKRTKSGFLGTATDNQVYAVQFLLAGDLPRCWDGHVEPGTFTLPLYVVLEDGTVAVATNLYDVTGEETDNLSRAVVGVFCDAQRRWMTFRFEKSDLTPVNLH